MPNCVHYRLTVRSEKFGGSERFEPRFRIEVYFRPVSFSLSVAVGTIGSRFFLGREPKLLTTTIDIAPHSEWFSMVAKPEVIPFLTLSFFAGIRRATLERLDWSDVRFEEKRVIVPAHKGKNQKRYQVNLSENAVEWLKP